MACRADLNRTCGSPLADRSLCIWGHAFAALTAAAFADPGQFLLRIEDIDQSRCRPEYEALIAQGSCTGWALNWPRLVMRQSERLPAIRMRWTGWRRFGLTYPCQCRRADIRAALSVPQEGRRPPDRPGWPGLSGTCRHRP